MTPEQTLDWLAEQHKSQCNEDRPVQEWIRSMKSMLPAPVQDVPETDFGNMTKDEALDMALEALEDLQRQYSIYPNSFWDWSKGRKAITAIKQARRSQTQGEEHMRDTIDMAREAGLFVARENPRYYGASLDSLKTFEALVRADEREVCAKVCDAYDVKYDVCSSDTAESIAAAIRARGNT